MFSIVRRKSRSQLVRQELGQSVEHFKQAANHAAQGTQATVGPKFYAARDRVQPAAGRVKDVASSGWGSTVATLAPLATAATAATSSVRKADAETRKNAAKKQAKLQKSTAKAIDKAKAKAKSKSKGKKKSKLGTLLLAGAAVGAAAAYVVRRRNTQQWDEYDPSRPVGGTDSTPLVSDDVVFEPAEPTGTGTFATPTPAPVTEVRPTTLAGDPTIAVVGKENEDQTSSALHSPTVARMAGGSTKS